MRIKCMHLRIVAVNWHPRYRYAIAGLKINGKRRRLFFETAREADEELGRLKIKARRQGQAGLDIPDDLRAQAVDCARKLKPFGKTIVDATSFYLSHLAASESVQIDQLVADYIHSQERGGLSARHLRDVRNRLTRFLGDFGSRPCRTVSPAELEEWLYGLHNGDGPAPQTVKNWRATVRAFFGWAQRQGAVDINPVDAVARPKVARGAPAVWSPDHLDRLLHAAPPELVPALTIGAFAGLRTAELLRLEWSEVNFRAGLIEVRSDKSKTAQRRLVKIEPNLARWLAPYAGNIGRIWLKEWRAYHDDVSKLCRELELEWLENGLRHSFASYHLAHFRNAAVLALEMGHVSPHVLFAHYREVTTPTEAAHYWQIVP